RRLLRALRWRGLRGVPGRLWALRELAPGRASPEAGPRLGRRHHGPPALLAGSAELRRARRLLGAAATTSETTMRIPKSSTWRRLARGGAFIILFAGA